MTDLQLNDVKRAGLEKHLLEGANSKCCEAKQHLELAVKGRFVNFESAISKARKSIDDAEQLWLETYKL